MAVSVYGPNRVGGIDLTDDMFGESTATAPAEPDSDPDGPMPGGGQPQIETEPVGDPSDPRTAPDRELVPA